MLWEDAIRDRFEVQSVSVNEFVCICKWHDDGNRGNLYVNGDTGLYFCFACGAKGSLESDLGEVPLRDAHDVLRVINKNRARDRMPKIYDESYLSPYLSDDPWDGWLDRGIPHDVQKKFSLGVDVFDSGTLIIPVRDRHRRLYGVVKRYIDGRVNSDGRKLKYHNPPLHMGQFLLGAEHLRTRHHKIAIVEGPIDALKCWSERVPAVASWGTGMTHNQEQVLRSSRIRELVLMYDNDAAGESAARSLQQQITWCRISVGKYRHYWRTADGTPVNDPGELTGQRIRKMFHSAE